MQSYNCSGLDINVVEHSNGDYSYKVTVVSKEVTGLNLGDVFHCREVGDSVVLRTSTGDLEELDLEDCEEGSILYALFTVRDRFLMDETVKAFL